MPSQGGYSPASQKPASTHRPKNRERWNLRLGKKIRDRLLQIAESISIIEERCKDVETVDELLASPWGMTILDACIMRIQVIGETIKSIDDKTQKNFLRNYPSIPWSKVVGLRNIISHE
ncbi:MAG: DUF86 domain-containing protein [Mediterranea sp.]|nr:DUF86 domain-containing protein [Mediterranea sp.]